MDDDRYTPDLAGPINSIIKLYKNRKLWNGVDEKDAGGFWDLAGNIRDAIIEAQDDEFTQDIIYQALTELHRQMRKEVNKARKAAA